jgi:hypothetical protein
VQNIWACHETSLALVTELAAAAGSQSDLARSLWCVSAAVPLQWDARASDTIQGMLKTSLHVRHKAVAGVVVARVACHSHCQHLLAEQRRWLQHLEALAWLLTRSSRL